MQHPQGGAHAGGEGQRNQICSHGVPPSVAVVGVSMGLVALASCGSKATDQTAGEIPIEMLPDTQPVASQNLGPEMAASDSVPDSLSSFAPKKGEVSDTYPLEIQPVGKVEPSDTIYDTPSAAEPEQVDSVASESPR